MGSRKCGFQSEAPCLCGDEYIHAGEQQSTYSNMSFERIEKETTTHSHWGTCLGLERLLQLIAQDSDATIVGSFDAENYPINLGFTGKYPNPSQD